MVGLLESLGLDGKVARVLTFLAQVDEGKSAEIERGCTLRQPEVSVATRDLRALGWITSEERRHGGKGRPVNYYRLSLPFENIIGAIESRKREEISGELAKIERLRGLVVR
ncbi:MAG: ArsR family transcriptional regulator [Thermoplasmatota archaeon]